MMREKLMHLRSPSLCILLPPHRKRRYILCIEITPSMRPTTSHGGPSSQPQAGTSYSGIPHRHATRRLEAIVQVARKGAKLVTDIRSSIGPVSCSQHAGQNIPAIAICKMPSNIPRELRHL